jgi:hypothetical protein
VITKNKNMKKEYIIYLVNHKTGSIVHKLSFDQDVKIDVNEKLSILGIQYTVSDLTEMDYDNLNCKFVDIIPILTNQ